MSGAGYCVKALSAKRLGYQTEAIPKWLASSANEGNWHELRIKDELKADGYTIYSEQEEITTRQELFDLVGHIDGKVEKDDCRRLLEVKSMSQFEFDRWMKGGFVAFPQYAAQIACYSYATRLDNILYVIKNRNNGYIDRREFNINELDSLFDIEPILQKLEYVETEALGNKLVEAEFDVNSIECKRCNYKYLCIPEPKAVSDLDLKIIHENIDLYRKGTQLAKKGEEARDEAKRVLQAYASEQPEKKFRMDEMAISVFSVKETPVSYVRKAYVSCMIKDLRKEE
jgi:hypothetical protein